MDAIPAGILSGISYVSGVDYYKGICEKYAEASQHVPLLSSHHANTAPSCQIKGKNHLMPPNPLLLMCSVDCDAYAKMLCENPIDFEASPPLPCLTPAAAYPASA
jgi:aspartate/glutamate racemase